MTDQQIDKLAEILWNYHLMKHTLAKADCLFVLGSQDLRVAERGAELYLQRFAPYIIFSGGFGNVTKGIFKKPEAQLFAETAIKMGVPSNKILIEDQSTNTGENIAFSKKLLAAKGLNFDTFILVQKPYMERRTFATFKKNWPEKEFIVTSPQIPFKDYPNKEITRDRAINLMVGDLQRIKLYPAKGFQIYQKIPETVWSAYKQLVKAGYTSHLIED